MKSLNLPEDEKVTREKLLKQRNEYKSFLKDYLHLYKQNQQLEEKRKH